MTEIREIELSEPLPPVQHLPVDRCMLVFRLHGRVVGRAFVPVTAGTIDAGALLRIVTASLRPEATRAWLDHHLDYDDRAVLDADPLTATVAICTRERPQDLQQALAGVAALSPAPDEVLVVDNAPTTNATREVAARFPGATYVAEPVLGLNVARNRALRTARGDIVAFTDDDAIPEPQWLGQLIGNFTDAALLGATGLVLPRTLATQAQEDFEAYSTFVRGFTRRVFDGQIDNPLAVGPVGAGASMALRRDGVLALGGFDERLDGGRATRSGGDHELFTRILRAGHRIAYDPAAVSWHRHRETQRELLDTLFGYGVGVYAMWTGLLVEHREIGVLKLAWGWFRHSHLRALVSPRGKEALLARTELRGCLHGPRAWFTARRRSHEQQDVGRG